MGSYFEYPTDKVSIPGGSGFVVRGLSLDDLSTIVAKHGDVLAELFNETAETGSIKAMTIASLAGELVRRAPEVAGMAIVLASDALDKFEDEGEGGGQADGHSSVDDLVKMAVATTQARRLPIHVQLDALQRIGALTFGTEGGIKKAWETIVSLLSGAQTLLRDQAA